ncbi:pyridoxamine 5'-phosphate oxidase family protein [Actinophytocola glycyrrhizae]|uniref:Pyridoxamine 5'-phosphate oxidase family protein n=1 Tax=Actinophytocola glycyrrhizae TaxID=2044873 RepID=A0ABV9S499_9PSEU
MGDCPPHLAELSRAESLRLLSEAPFGRIVYTVRALPAIVPVRHRVEDGMVIVRSHVGGDCAGSVVAFQADGADDHAPGWSITVTGVARRIVDTEEIAHFETLITPLVDMGNVEVIRIFPEIVTGYRLTSGD